MARVNFSPWHVLVLVVTGSAAHAQNVTPTCPSPTCQSWYRPFTEESQPDVFYNLYVPGNGGSPAAAYPAPYPTPPLVGHTYYTYQPLMPQEFLYKHHRTYHQYYNNGMGLNRTKVVWHGTPVRTGLHELGSGFLNVMHHYLPYR